MSTTTKSNETIHPIVSLVKPTHRSSFNLVQTIYILTLKKKGCTNRETAKRYFAETGIDLSTERVGQIYRRFKEGLKYV